VPNNYFNLIISALHMVNCPIQANLDGGSSLAQTTAPPQLAFS